MARYIDYAKIPMQKNDIGAKTIGEYFGKLLLTLWGEQEDFSGKRPFGNSGWEYDVYASLISAGVVDGSLDEEGYVVDVTYSAANDIVCKMIKQIFSSTADVAPKSEVDRLKAVMKEMDEQRAYTINMLGESLEKAKSEVERWRRNLEAVLEERAEEKTEVARVIFAEIDDAYEDCIVILGDMGYLQPSKFEQKLAELKKKYTEGGGNV